MNISKQILWTYACGLYVYNNNNSTIRCPLPVAKEPTGLSFSDRKRPGGLTPVPWQNSKTFFGRHYRLSVSRLIHLLSRS